MEHPQKQEKGQKRTYKKGIYRKGIDMKYEFCLKIECIDVNYKLNTHLAIESHLERKREKNICIPFSLFRI